MGGGVSDVPSSDSPLLPSGWASGGGGGGGGCLLRGSAMLVNVNGEGYARYKQRDRVCWHVTAMVPTRNDSRV